jgi:hypothetical protein
MMLVFCSLLPNLCSMSSKLCNKETAMTNVRNRDLAQDHRLDDFATPLHLEDRLFTNDD